MPARPLSMNDPRLRLCTGTGVRVAVVDSGAAPGHPHLVPPTDGINLAEGPEDDWLDRLGHGTAVAAAILEKAPGIAWYAVRVFDRRLDTTGDALVAAIDRAVSWGADLVNLSLGSAREDRRPAFQAAVDRAVAAGCLIVAPVEEDGRRLLPGSCTGVVRVVLDWDCPREALVIEADDAVRASGYPRPIPGVPMERNLKGVSFAVANATGLIARMLDATRRSNPTLPAPRLLRAWSDTA